MSTSSSSVNCCVSSTFAAERRAAAPLSLRHPAAAVIDRYVLHAGPISPSKPDAAACSGQCIDVIGSGTDRRTDIYRTVGPVVKVDRRIRWHYVTTTILRHWYTTHEVSK